MAETLTLDVIGTLVYLKNDLWKGIITIVFFDKACEIPLSARISETGSTANQVAALVAALENFKRQHKRIMDDVQNHLFQYYMSEIEQYRAQVGAVTADHPTVPIITSVKEMANLVEPKSVYCPYGKRFGLLFNCTWEPELGVGVVIENDGVKAIGPQDILL